MLVAEQNRLAQLNEKERSEFNSSLLATIKRHMSAIDARIAGLIAQDQSLKEKAQSLPPLQAWARAPLCGCLRISELGTLIRAQSRSASSCWERLHNLADVSRLDVARAFSIKVKPNHVCAEFNARACIVRICNTADFDLYRIGAIDCSHGAVPRWGSDRTGHRPVATTNLRGRLIFGASDEITKSRFGIGCAH